MKNLFTILIAILTVNSSIAQITLIPDTNFEQALITLGHDSILNGSVLTSNINGVTNLDVSNSSISNLTGIEDFTALTFLWCNDNLITNLNLSKHS